MKTLPYFYLFAWFSVAALHGQDVPPAFENKDGGEAEAPKEDMLDPFDPTVNAPKMVRVQVEFIEMAHKDLTRLMMEEKTDRADATALRMKLQAMVDGEKAKILDTQIVVARSGQKATVESIHEFTYPVEYEPMNWMPPQDGEKAGEVPVQNSVPFNPAMPSTFESKNVGSTLEIEPTIGSDDKVIDLRFLPEFIWHTGDRVWNERKDELGNVTKVTMPDFYKLSVNTSITCISGQYVMVGVASPKNEAGEVDIERKTMIFVKCNVLSSVP